MAIARERVPTKEERAATLQVAEREAGRDARRALFIGAAMCLVWLAVGLYLLGLSVHVTDQKIGNLLFWLGLVVGNSGILLSIVWTVRRAEARGDYGPP
jgi:hypothetical protein